MSKISNMTAVETPALTDSLAVVQAGEVGTRTRKATMSQYATIFGHRSYYGITVDSQGHGDYTSVYTAVQDNQDAVQLDILVYNTPNELFDITFPCPVNMTFMQNSVWFPRGVTTHTSGRSMFTGMSVSQSGGTANINLVLRDGEDWHLESNTFFHGVGFGVYNVAKAARPVIYASESRIDIQYDYCIADKLAATFSIACFNSDCGIEINHCTFPQVTLQLGGYTSSTIRHSHIASVSAVTPTSLSVCNHNSFNSITNVTMPANNYSNTVNNITDPAP